MADPDAAPQKGSPSRTDKQDEPILWTRFQAVRKERGLSLNAVVQLVKDEEGEWVNPDGIRNWSKGHMPNAYTLTLVAKVLRVSPGYLLGIESDRLGEVDATEGADRDRESAADEEGGDVAGNDG